MRALTSRLGILALAVIFAAAPSLAQEAAAGSGDLAAITIDVFEINRCVIRFTTTTTNTSRRDICYVSFDNYVYQHVSPAGRRDRLLMDLSRGRGGGPSEVSQITPTTFIRLRPGDSVSRNQEVDLADLRWILQIGNGDTKDYPAPAGDYELWVFDYVYDCARLTRSEVRILSSGKWEDFGAMETDDYLALQDKQEYVTSPGHVFFLRPKFPRLGDFFGPIVD